MLDLTVQILLISAAAIYLLGFLLSFKYRKSALVVFGLGWLINLAIFVINWFIADSPPFGNMYHVMSFLPLCLLPIYIYVKHVQNLEWLLGYFSFAAFITITGSYFMGHEMTWNRMPALQSPWFVPHVSTYILSYSLATVAFMLIIKSFIGDNGKRYENAAYQMMLLSFPFMTFGLFSGALWAEEVWGAYWSWDIKETWSLITWGTYLIYFHCRKNKDLQKWQRLVHILAFSALLITFFVVNLLPKIKSLHSYAR